MGMKLTYLNRNLNTITIEKDGEYWSPMGNVWFAPEEDYFVIGLTDNGLNIIPNGCTGKEYRVIKGISDYSIISENDFRPAVSIFMTTFQYSAFADNKYIPEKTEGRKMFEDCDLGGSPTVEFQTLNASVSTYTIGASQFIVKPSCDIYGNISGGTQFLIKAGCLGYVDWIGWDGTNPAQCQIWS